MNYSIRANVSTYQRGDSNVKGFASVVFGDSFKVGNISILENKETGQLYVSMPSYRTKQFDDRGKPVYQDVCFPITKAFRDRLYGVILHAYHEEKDRDDDILDLSQAEEWYDKDMDKSDNGYVKISEEAARRVDEMFR